MSAQPKPLMELAREWRKIGKSPLQWMIGGKPVPDAVMQTGMLTINQCADDLEAALKAWHDFFTEMWEGRIPKIDRPVSEFVRERVLGVEEHGA